MEQVSRPQTESLSQGQGLQGHGMKGASLVPIRVRGVSWGCYVRLCEAILSMLAFGFLTLQSTYTSRNILTVIRRHVVRFMRESFLFLSSSVLFRDRAGKGQFSHKSG